MDWSSSFRIRVQNPRRGLSRGFWQSSESNRIGSNRLICGTESNRIVFFFAESPITTIQPHCVITRRNRCKDLNTSPLLENWRRPPGRPRTTWMKTIQQDWNHLTSPWTKQSTWLNTAIQHQYILTSKTCQLCLCRLAVKELKHFAKILNSFQPYLPLLLADGTCRLVVWNCTNRDTSMIRSTWRHWTITCLVWNWSDKWKYNTVSQ